IVLLLITFLTTRERVQPPKGQKSSFGQDLKDVSKNLPWIIIFIASVFWLIHNMIRNGMVAYYFNNVNGEGSKVMCTWMLGPLKLDFDQTTVFLTIQTFGMMTGVFLSTPLKKCFGRKTLMIFFSLISVVLSGVFYWLPAKNFVVLSVINFLWAIVAGAIPVFFFAMFADVADFHQWKFRQRATGLIIAGIMFAIKMGVAVGGFLGLYILGQYGYDKELPITPEVIHGIKLLFSIIPAGFMLVCGIIICLYPINEKMLTQIEANLKERSKSELEN
ncbi:MFS transporter, partial [candidate division KSB1 bacterium]|nr:MFS transporter [candidate division KSB1 bacterium]